MSVLRRIFVSFFIFGASFSLAEDDHGANVVSFTSESFKAEILKTPHFVMFFAPWCGHCKRLAPVWDELAVLYNTGSGDSPVVIGKVDCTLEKELCKAQGVTGYPTIKIFKGEDISEGLRYKGGRDLDALKTFVAEQFNQEPVAAEAADVPEPPKPVSSLVELDDDFSKTIANGKWFVKFFAPWCGHCKKLAPIWEELAQTFEHSTELKIAKIDCTKYNAVCKSNDIKGYPTLQFFNKGVLVDEYGAGRTHADLKKYVSSFLEPTEEGTRVTPEDIPEEIDEPEAENFVHVLNSENFDVMVSTGLSFVKFYAPWCGHCKRLAPTWVELATKFSDSKSTNILIAEVDCTVHSDLCKKHQVKGYPTLILFHDGEQIEKYSNKRDLETLFEFVVKHQRVHDEF